uniref:FAD-binding protein n=1 Tax=Faecalibacterium gallinarum TaxID=2903556 RepID=UPI0035A21E6F
MSAITSGLEVDKDARVLDENGQPIEGFYAVGNCSGPFYGSVDYPLDIPGLSISRAITLGYVVGKTLAQQ